MDNAPLRMVFCGTPQFAVPSLHHLLQVPEFEIVAVLTQPDRPRGRGQEITFAPVKEAALAAKLPLHQPAKVRVPEVEEQLQRTPAGCDRDYCLRSDYSRTIARRTETRLD